MANIGVQGFVVVVLLIVVLFGGKKIPELAKGLGQGLRLFKNEIKDEAAKNSTPAE